MQPLYGQIIIISFILYIWKTLYIPSFLPTSNYQHYCLDCLYALPHITTP